MLAVTIYLCTFLPYIVLAQKLDVIDEKPEGMTIVKEDPNAGQGEIYTSTYQLQKFFEEEQGKTTSL